MPWRDELLPMDLCECVRDVAERTQCPPDFVGVALLVAISAVVGRKFSIRPKQHDDWKPGSDHDIFPNSPQPLIQSLHLPHGSTHSRTRASDISYKP